MGFLTGPGDEDEPVGDEEDDDGNLIDEFEPGIIVRLPAGIDFVPWDPQHPTSAFPDFVSACLRSIASAFDVGYVSLANDLTGVTYGSLRQGKLDERDVWRMLQFWMIDHFCQPVYEKWLTWAPIVCEYCS